MSGTYSGLVHRNGPHPDHVDRDGKPYGQRARGLRSVLLAVADAANANGQHAHPGIDFVASATLYSRRQAINLLDELVQEQWILVTEEGGGRGRATVYDFTERVHSPPPGTEETVQSPPTKGAVTDGNGAVQSAPQRTNNEGLNDNTLVLGLPALVDPVAAVWETWQTSTGHHRAVLDTKRRKKIRAALDTYPLDDVLAAVQGWAYSPWHRGENPGQTVYDGVELLLRDAGQIEKFRDLYLDHLARTAEQDYAAPRPSTGATCGTCEGKTWVYDDATEEAVPCPVCRAGIIP